MRPVLHLRAFVHEWRCAECRVNWRSMFQRVVGLKRGFTPNASK